jgi:hypothetical protein
MRLSSLTLVLVATGPNGVTESRTITRPLTESNLLNAATLLLSGDADESGRRVVALRASAP